MKCVATVVDFCLCKGKLAYRVHNSSVQVYFNTESLSQGA